VFILNFKNQPDQETDTFFLSMMKEKRFMICKELFDMKISID